jgi:predicted AAA+ superfamily ATPase
MKPRSLAEPIEDLAFSGHKIAFLSGPRQCGKTTLAKMLLRQRKIGIYRNWDQAEFRRAWAMNPSAIVPRAEGENVPLLVLDEIHKDRRWKRNLKGVFDTLETPCDILVTGSARLNVT